MPVHEQRAGTQDELTIYDLRKKRKKKALGVRIHVHLVNILNFAPCLMVLM